MDQDHETAKSCRSFFLNVFLFPSSEHESTSIGYISALILTYWLKKLNENIYHTALECPVFLHKGVGSAHTVSIIRWEPLLERQLKCCIAHSHTDTEPDVRFQNKIQAPSPERLPRKDPRFVEAGGIAAVIAADFC